MKSKKTAVQKKTGTNIDGLFTNNQSLVGERGDKLGVSDLCLYDHVVT